MSTKHETPSFDFIKSVLHRTVAARPSKRASIPSAANIIFTVTAIRCPDPSARDRRRGSMPQGLNTITSLVLHQTALRTSGWVGTGGARCVHNSNTASLDLGCTALKQPKYSSGLHLWQRGAWNRMSTVHTPVCTVRSVPRAQEHTLWGFV